MSKNPFKLEIQENEEYFDLKGFFFKYAREWKWFALGIILFLFAGFLYLKNSSKIYQTVAKVKILDETKNMNISIDPMANLTGFTQTNTDNEIEVLHSYRLLNEVVKDLNLDIAYFQKGSLRYNQIWDPPFEIKRTVASDSIEKHLDFSVRIDSFGFQIKDPKKRIHKIGFYETSSELPFEIHVKENIDLKAYENIRYRIGISPLKEVVFHLIEELKVQAVSKNSSVLLLTVKGENPQVNEAVLNTVIEKFNEDGIKDRQLISRRTLDFIDERFEDLAGELSAIEGRKESFKASSSLSYIEADAGISLQEKTKLEEELNKLHTQISLSQLLKESLNSEDDFELLPADIGLESSGINLMVSNYNQTALMRQKIASSAGESNPKMQELSNELQRGRENIINTVNIFQRQQEVALEQLSKQRDLASARFSSFPGKENVLRSIERQQSIKESLYLLLLQKREEAGINYAVTAPTVKVVEYAVTGTRPVSPKRNIVMGISLLMGLLLPFGFIYLRNSFDTKIHDRKDLEKSAIPIAAEIPKIEHEKLFNRFSENNPLTESFRILSTNARHLLPKKEEGRVILVTSSVIGEGKTFVAVNLALALASLKKKVLLVGADFRSPKIQEIFGQNTGRKGLSDYLDHPDSGWEELVYKNKEHAIDILFSGRIMQNIPALLSNPGYPEFLEEAKTRYNFIVIDSAPALLVTDTLLISEFTDLTLLVLRAGHTEKKLLEYSAHLASSGKLTRMAYVLNAVDFDKTKSFNYGYGYGYFQE